MKGDGCSGRFTRGYGFKLGLLRRRLPASCSSPWLRPTKMLRGALA